MTTPTVPDPPPTTQPITCPIELDPLAAPCGTGLEGWGGVLPAPMEFCVNGATVIATDVAGQQAAVTAGGQFGACVDLTPEPVVEVPIDSPALPVTGFGSAEISGLAAVSLLAGALCLRLRGYRRASCASSS